jgi:hypothetical protein
MFCILCETDQVLEFGSWNNNNWRAYGNKYCIPGGCLVPGRSAGPLRQSLLCSLSSGLRSADTAPRASPTSRSSRCGCLCSCPPPVVVLPRLQGAAQIYSCKCAHQGLQTRHIENEMEQSGGMVYSQKFLSRRMGLQLCWFCISNHLKICVVIWRN